MQILTPPCPRERVGFVVPRWNTAPGAHRQGLPFRCLPVAGALYGSGHEVVFCDQEPDLDRDRREDALRAALAGCRVVFFWNQDLEPAGQAPNLLHWAARVKAWFPAVKVVAGGGFLAVVPREALDLDGPIDGFFRGYGEEACPALMAALRGEAGWDEVPGLVWREGDVRLNPVGRPPRFRPEYLVPYHLLELTRYVQKGGIFGNGFGTLNIGTGQGCAKRCGFCYWRNHAPSLLPAAAIVDLVAYLHEGYGVTQYHLGELDFFASKKRVLELAARWQERVPACRWFALASPADAMRLTEEEWDRVAAGGCRKLEFGSESGSRAVLRAMGKRHDPEAAYVLSRRCLRRGIVPMHNFVFGLLGETEPDRRASLALIRRLAALDPGRVHLTFRLYQPCPETPMGEAAISRPPGFPRTLEDILHHRHHAGATSSRAAGWLGARDERRVKELVNHYLPLVTSRLRFASRPERWTYQALRLAARLRVRTNIFAAGLDRWLYGRLLHRPLDNTYACGSA